MNRLLPTISWPTELREAGPVVDPSIMLVGEATIGATDFVVTAVRMNEYRTGPDYHHAINARLYEKTLWGALDALDFLMDYGNPVLLPLEGGTYLLWMVPTDK